MIDLENYADREMMALDLAGKLASDLIMALETRARVTFSVPGGTTPGPVFDTLSGVDLDWSRVDVLLNDERWVPESSPRSNTALVRKRLLTGRAAAAHLVPLYSGHATPEEGLAELIEGVKPTLPISVLLLGMGEDMHTASLFPGADKLQAALADDAPPLMAMRAPGAGEPRVTLTAPVLKGADVTHLLITGDAKRAAMRKANVAESLLEAPVKLVLDRAQVHWAA